MPKFNEAQMKAIEAENENILISAAAGSGKTTVMVQKIRETLMRHPSDSISQFLVLTFTNDAADHMREKLRELLEKDAEEENPAAIKALSEIEAATISTIHAFCKRLLSEYNDDVNQSMNPRVLKDSERERMLDEAFTDAVEAVLGNESTYSEGEKKVLHQLLAAFDTNQIRSMVMRLYDVLMGIPDPFARLHEMTNTSMVSVWRQEVLLSLDLELLSLEELIRKEQELIDSGVPESCQAECIPKSEDDIVAVRNLLSLYPLAKTPEARLELLEGTKKAMRRTNARGLKDDDKEWYEQFKDIRNSIKGSTGVIGSMEKALKDLQDEKHDRLNAVIQHELQGLEVLVREMDAQYAKQKLDAGAIDYSDMEQTAYRIISDPEKRDELHQLYKYIYVDECQDVSEIQNAILEALAGPGRQFFMVGDIKQSIYGFRHAVPVRFLEKRERYGDGEDDRERRIFFLDNYRSCRTIVNSVNAVFQSAMDRRITEMDYAPQDQLRCNRDGDFGPVDVMLIRKSDDTDQLEAQCEAAGKYIENLVTSGTETGYSYRDIVILVRSARTDAPRMMDYFQKLHIPVLYDGGQDFFGLSEIKAFVSLLTVIDNLHHDDELVGTLINVPFSFTDADLGSIRATNLESVPFYQVFEACALRNETELDQRCRVVYDQIQEWGRIASDMSVSDFVWWLMRDAGIYAARGAFPDGRARQANLDVLYQRALDGEKAGQLCLSDFVRDIRNAAYLKTAGSDEHPAAAVGDNFVRLMTMHKAKGLEFPVVILMNLQKDMFGRREESRLKINVSDSGPGSPALGLYLPAVRRNTHSIMDTIGKDAFSLREKRTGIAENTRLLYVAMTRAEQKLCLIGGMKDGSDREWRSETRASRIYKEKTMLDMIMPAVLKDVELPEAGQTAESGLWRVTVLQGKPVQDSDMGEVQENPQMDRILQQEAPMLMYLPEPVSQAALKTSVTSLIRDQEIRYEEDSTETVLNKRQNETVMPTYRLNADPDRPAFMDEEKARAVDIGSTTHRFLRLIHLNLFRELAKTEDGESDARWLNLVKTEADSMAQKKILSDEEARLIRYKGVASFLKSDLGRRMLNSQEVHREWNFMMQIRPDSPTMVQGIIDCAFLEDGEWVLIDYKTDRDTAPETFVPRHEAQMNWYRTALERLTGKKVREMWLYSLRAYEAFPVPVRDPISSGTKKE